MLYFVVVLLNVVMFCFIYDTYSKLSDLRSSLKDGLERLQKLEGKQESRVKPQEKPPQEKPQDRPQESKFKPQDKREYHSRKPKKHKHHTQQTKAK